MSISSQFGETLKEWLIILNPAAGNSKARKKWPDIQMSLKEHGINYESEISNHSGHIISLARKGIEKGFRRIAVVGGDGSLHELVNGVMDQKLIPATDILVAVIPIGTGNDWIRSYTQKHSIRSIILSLKGEQSQKQEVGLCTFYQDGKECQRYFANMAGMAYDAFVVKQILDHPPKFSGKWMYILRTLSCLWKYPVVLTELISDERNQTRNFITINAAIGKFAGGGMIVVPHAKGNDGKLSVLTSSGIYRFRIFLNSFRFFTGTIHEVKGVETFESERIEVKSHSAYQIPLEADGEFLGYSPITIKVIPDALRIISYL